MKQGTLSWKAKARMPDAHGLRSNVATSSSALEIAQIPASDATSTHTKNRLPVTKEEGT